MPLLRRICLALTIVMMIPLAHAAERVLPPQSKSSVASLTETARNEGTVKVIVGLRVPFAAEGKLMAAEAQAQRTDIARAATSLKSRYAGAIKRRPASFRAYGSIPYAAIEVTPAELDLLSRDPAVVSITPNRRHKANLVQSIPMIGADVAQQLLFNGSGQMVAILDDGVDKNHPFLKGRVLAEACFSEDGICLGGATSSTAVNSGLPCGAACIHGTHVAGIVAGSDATSKGVAPQATLMAIKVLAPDGAWESDIVAGLEHVHSRRNDFSIAAVNMSLGNSYVEPDGCTDYSGAAEAVMKNLSSEGIAIVVASGNNGSVYGLSWPACSPSTIAVGAVSTKNWGNCMGIPKFGPTARDKVTCYSNTSSKLALLAPGDPIRSSVPGNGFAVYGGTSMAAPHVAGAVAVLKQKAPSASVQEILDALMAGGQMVSDYRTGQQTPRIDVKGALDFLDTNTITLSYTKAGTGQGTVSFTPGTEMFATGPADRNSCAGSCVVSRPAGRVSLTAAPAAGSIFEGWLGACTGTDPSCEVDLTEAKAVTATFSRPRFPVDLNMAGTGIGSVEFVSSPQNWSFDCEGDCVQEFDKDSKIVAIPSPDDDSLFGGWSGACSGQSSCTFSMTSAKDLTAVFTRKTGSEKTLSYSETGMGGGYVTFQPIGSLTSCGGACIAEYSPETRVNVTATPDPYSTFKGWSGACTTSSSVCTVTMSAARTITANFILNNVLTYTRAGTGTGTVGFSPEGSNEYCFGSCQNYFPPGTTVSLIPYPTNGSTFQGWGGSCSGTGKCSVQMSKARSVTATFAVPPPKVALTYQKLGAGNGMVSVSPSGGNATCTANCVNSYTQGTSVTLRVRAVDPSSVFAGWTGACRGYRNCTVKLLSATTVGAVFNARPVYTLNYVKAGTGQGKVTFSPASTNPVECASSCSKPYIERTTVTLRAAAAPGSVFTGWSGNCKGRKTCTVSMIRARSVTATFALKSSGKSADLDQ